MPVVAGAPPMQIAADPGYLGEDDLRFADNPLVTGAPDIRFYAGCPIKGPFGYRVGTLCLIDRSPREFTHEDGEMLRDLGAMVESELRVRALHSLSA